MSKKFGNNVTQDRINIMIIRFNVKTSFCIQIIYYNYNNNTMSIVLIKKQFTISIKEENL